MMRMPLQMLLKYMTAEGTFSTLAESCLVWLDYVHEFRLISIFCSGELHFMAANNDCSMREYDMERFQLLNHFHFPWPVNVCLLQVLCEHLGLCSQSVPLHFLH